MKEYKVKVIEEYNDYLSETWYQEVLNPEEKTIYSVCNMCECPEDATIERNLVSAFEYLDILNAGIELAKQGYDKVTYTCCDE
jgi:hypothetical protein